ncbi:MAG: sugar ABC transporter permease [Ruminococcaceae bacterium]|nr:sugar ABC transporter permease [Oscillospiraceae bacterium]
MNSVAAPTTKRKRPTASLEKTKARSGWLFVFPFLFGFLTIYMPIIFKSIYYSFNNFYPADSRFEFVGLAKYQEALFENLSFLDTLKSGLGQLILDIPAIVIFSLFIAVILNQKMLGRAAFRAIFFIPVILATGLIDDIDNKGNTFMDNVIEQEGIDSGSGSSASDIIGKADIALLFENMKIGGGMVDIVTGLVNDIYNIINRSGVQMLIFLSGLQNISPAIYESCSIDGATGWETFWKITFPMISPMILVNAVYTVIDSFTSSSNEVMSLVLNTYNEGSLTLSSAMAWMYFILVIIIIAVVAGILSAYTFYQRRD